MDLSIDWFSIIKRKKLTESQRNMKRWTEQDWVDMANPEGKKKEGTYKRGRYAPRKVAEKMTSEERAAENRKKREGRKKGKQHVPRTKKGKKIYATVE